MNGEARELLTRIPKYVFAAEDPRKIPLNQCASLGDLMATITRCKELDAKDRKKKRRIKGV